MTPALTPPAPPRVDPSLWAKVCAGLPSVGPEKGCRVLVAMSGGVDSSVTAALLHAAGYEVIGISMQLFDKSETSGGTGRCCTLDDFQDARRVAQVLGFPHYVLDFRSRFAEAVISPFIEHYKNGLTPSPCINCNQFLKFDALMDTAQEVQADYVATGHYAQILPHGSSWGLFKACDPFKDQSYFLFGLSTESLARTLMPLGGLSKPEVRALGKALGLHLADKADSQEICFIESGDYSQFLEERGLRSDPGDIRHTDGRVLGHHRGTWRFTVGQRRGLGIAHPSPLYVTGIDPGTRTVWVGEASDLDRQELTCAELSWAGSPPALPSACLAKIRSRSPESPARLEVGPVPGSLRVRFDAPQRAITPGQAVVFYEGTRVMGGGWIRSAG